MIFDKKINERFQNFIRDWNYKTYLCVGGYGSSKSYHIVLKLISKAFNEKRKILVVRKTLESIRESCFDLFVEILEEMNLRGKKKGQCIINKNPMQIRFSNGSKIIFKGMDGNLKVKSINGVSIVWMEEASELEYSNFKELLFRLRVPNLKIHFILSTNPVTTQNWVFRHFFKQMDDKGNYRTVLDDKILYERRTVVKNNVYYHHSLPDDNQFLPDGYIEQLEEIASYDPDLHRIARLGQFGTNGVRVLPQFQVAETHKSVRDIVDRLPEKFHFNGMDFGFETSYNAILRTAVDDKNKILYIYGEYYKNKMTDDKTAVELIEMGWNKIPITADCEDPKAIFFYQQSGFKMRKCKKWAGSRLYNTRKIKRFKQIICSPDCHNTVRELKELVYKVDKNDIVIYDDFNMDAHTFSALWYALDLYEVADIKIHENNSWKGSKR